MSLTEDQQLIYAQHLFEIQKYDEAKQLFSKLSESDDDKVKQDAKSYLKKLKSKSSSNESDHIYFNKLKVKREKHEFV